MKSVLEKVKAFVQSLSVGRLGPALSQQAEPNYLKPKSDYKKPQRRVDRVFLHCSASDNPDHDSAEVIRRWHLERGFDDIGYHFFINNNGGVIQGRNIEQTPAAQKGNNKHTVAICLHGLKKFNNKQFKALEKLCREINEAHNGEITFHGHNEVSNKACPVFDYKGLLKLDDNGKLGSY